MSGRGLQESVPAADARRIAEYTGTSDASTAWGPVDIDDLDEAALERLLERRAAGYNSALVLKPRPDGGWAALICMHFDPSRRTAGRLGVPLRVAEGASRWDALTELARIFTAPPPSSNRERR